MLLAVARLSTLTTASRLRLLNYYYICRVGYGSLYGRNRSICQQLDPVLLCDAKRLATVVLAMLAQRAGTLPASEVRKQDLSICFRAYSLVSHK